MYQVQFQPIVNEETAKYTKPSLRGDVYVKIKFWPISWQKLTLYKQHVSNHVALDHQTYSALAQHTQITWTVNLNVMSITGWKGGGWVYIT